MRTFLKPRPFLLYISALLLAYSAFATDEVVPAIEVTRVETSSIEIDGVLDEEAWQNLPLVKDFLELSPATLKIPPYQTKVRIFYTAKGLYIGIQADQPEETLIERLSSRDQFITRDGLSVTLDPSGEGLYAYWFGVNLGNSISDGTVLPERQYRREWDGPWRGETARNKDGFAAEYFLPFSMMTMPETNDPQRKMGIYISRQVGHKNEWWGWPALPSTQTQFLSSLQTIVLDNFNPAKQFTFYPYVSGNYDVLAGEDDYKTGFDIFWRPSSNLQITAAINPDFGNIESDDVVVNLTSIETFFPEKRPFFLEGQEIFTTTPRARSRGRGTPTILVNTRRIGSPPETPSVNNLEIDDIEANQLTELVGAAKVTGQTGSWRYGVITAVEDETKIEANIEGLAVDLTAKGRTFGAARFLYESTKGGARKGLGWITTLVDHAIDSDATVHGVDGHYLSADGRWNIDGQLLYSDVNGTSGSGGFADITYAPKLGHSHRIALNYFDDALDINDFGFMRRNDAITIRYNYQLTEPDVNNLKERETSLTLSQEYNTDGLVVRSGIFFNQEREFINNTELETELNYYPARWDDLSSRGNGNFRINPRWQAGLSWSSDKARPFQARLGFYLQDEDIKGNQKNYKLSFNWRPSDRFAFKATAAFRHHSDWLIHFSQREFTTYQAEYWQPRFEVDYFLSAKQQFRLILQWIGVKAKEKQRWQVPIRDGALEIETTATENNRDFTISNLSFQARYRWEIAPLSDLFVVYTRGSDLPNRPGDSFSELLSDGWTKRGADSLVVKLRYRLGN